MKYRLHKDKDLKEDHIEIFYQKMTPHVQRIIECIEDIHYIQGVLEGEKHKIAVQDIYYFETVDQACFGYMEKDVYKVGYTLGQLEENMAPYGFARISKSFIVNIMKVESIKSEGNMRIKAYLENGEALLVSRRYKRCFEETLGRLYNGIRGEDV